jgi:cytochrome c-type biogenesis protein
MKFDGSQVNILIAFIGGFVTFFASCLLPLVPTYLAYLAGLSASLEDEKTLRKEIFLNGLLFTIGFISVFILLGATANTLGRGLVAYRPLIQKLGGILFLILGAFVLGIIKPSFLYKEFKIKLPKNLTKIKEVNSFLVGTTFGFAWTPCIGPVLAVILFWASQAATVWKGMALLTAYGIGLGAPFLIIALGFEHLAPKLRKANKFGRIVQYISGIVVILVGILLILGKLDLIAIYLIQLLGFDALSI